MLRTSLAIFLVAGIALVAVGATYLSADEFMPYHARAIDAAWSDLDADYRGLMLGFLKGLGAGALIAGLAIVFMTASSFTATVRPYRLLLPLVANGYSLLLCYATYTVSVSTPGNPPLQLTLLLVGACVLATLLLMRAARKREAGAEGAGVE